MRGCSGRACVVALGGVCGFFRGAGACMVFSRGTCMVFVGGCAWFFPGGCAWFFLGGHAWFFLGGMRDFSWGACMVFSGGRAWFFPGGHAWFFLRGACVGYDEIRSMSGRYTSYWNAFLLRMRLKGLLTLTIKVSIFLSAKNRLNTVRCCCLHTCFTGMLLRLESWWLIQF